MVRLAQFALPLGAFLAAMAVGLGAYAAHGLDKLIVDRGFQSELGQRLDWFETGVRYHMYHALSLVLIGIYFRSGRTTQMLGASSLMFLLGILLFSGSLYSLALVSAEFRWLGAITPLGGLSFIVGWLLLAIATWKS